MPEVEVRDVSKHFTSDGQKQVTAVCRASFEVWKSQLVSIVGPSGCGKTTIARIVAGLLVPSAGDIRFEGQAAESRSRSVGMVFQDYSKSLFPWLTVLENVELGLLTTSMNRRSKRQVALTMLTRVGLEEVADQHIWELSGGMQQRVAFARALVRKPRVLVLDEPFGALDMFTRMRLQDELLALKKALGLTLLLVTHDVDEAVYLSDVIIVMGRAGRIVASLKVPLGYPRDQVASRSQIEFSEVRNAVLRSLNLVRSTPAWH
jgi:ABC-type nitrate/sulfonate/bicarbonate transport system ATPase subunit